MNKKEFEALRYADANRVLSKLHDLAVKDIRIGQAIYCATIANEIDLFNIENDKLLILLNGVFDK